MTENYLKGEKDEDLADRVKSGSNAGFEELINRYSSRLYHYLRPKMKNSQDVEDLVQETFLKAYKNIAKFDKKYKFSTWIYTIATRWPSVICASSGRQSLQWIMLNQMPARRANGYTKKRNRACGILPKSYQNRSFRHYG